MKKLRNPLTSCFLLTVFLSYLLLSCAYDNENGSKESSVLVKTIQKRLAKGDYEIESVRINPYSKYGKQSAEFLKHLSKKYSKNDKALKRLMDNRFTKSNIFRLTAVSENETMAIDVSENYDAALLEMTAYLDGIVDPNVLASQLQEANNLFSNYTPTYAGAQQFFLDCETTGLLTPAQSAIIQAELNGLLQVNSSEEAINLNAMIEQEVIQSAMSTIEQEEILQTTALIDNLLESEAIAAIGLDNNCDLYQNAAWGGAGFIGLGLVIAGIVMYSLGVDDSVTRPIMIIGLGLFGLGAFM